MELSKQSVLLIGGGEVAERKLDLLLKANAKITVVSPEFTDYIKELISSNQNITTIIDDYKKEKADSSQLNITKFTVASLEYLTRNLLLAKEFGKKEFRYCELLQESMDDLDKGMRPNIVLNNLAIVSSKL